MKTIFDGNKTELTDFKWFDIEKTFECGQCFRWDKAPDGSYTGVVSGRVIRAVQGENSIVFENIGKNEYEDFFFSYFDLGRKYTEINRVFKADGVLPKAMDASRGIRLLNQDVFETLISFIISQNNNIPRIKKIIKSLCENFGKEIKSDFGTFYSFPEAKELEGVTAEDLAVIKSGFRAKYIKDAVKKVNSGEVMLSDLKNLNYEAAGENLMKIKGVGQKVSDCVLLFSCGFVDAFPKDVWIKRILKEFYNDENIGSDYFGGYGGIAQQYLFNYAREIKLGK